MKTGTRIGPYEVLSLLGAGGMGEVYRAHDTTLNRDVAIKVLPQSFANDPDRLARFKREAQVLASLNHPNIAHIHGLEQSGGVRALVMELVEGEDLARRIERGPVPLDEALSIAKQIAEALEAAHEQGIIHRDLKPANIKVRPDGTVKVLDFGLAKAMEPASASSPHITQSPTITSPAMTAAGMILGTAAYMSPEQARGRTVDKRSDVWAFGCVLYEMLSGKRAFVGEDVTDTIVSVVSKDPDWAPIPIRLRRLLEACLEKNPKQRLRDIGDVWRLLGDLPFAENTSARPHVRSAVPWTLAGAVMAAFLSLAWTHYRESVPDVRTVRFTLVPADGTLPRDPFGVSPDGKWVAFGAAGSDGVVRLWARSLDSLDARPLAGTEGVSAGGVFWSPDSRFIGFVSGGAVKKVDVSGGPPQTLCGIPTTASFRGGAWNHDGVVIFGVRNVGLMQVSAAGGSPVLVTAETGADTSPAFLPDGRHFLYSKVDSTSERGIYLGSLGDSPADQRATPLIVNQVAGVVYALQPQSSVGHILFERDGALMAQPFDERRLELAGEAATVSAGLPGGPNVVRSFSASSGGVIVYRSGESTELSSLLWFDRRGTRLGQVGEPGAYGNVVLSHDGTTLAVGRSDASSGAHTWIVDLARGVFGRLNPGEGTDTPGAIAPDGRVAFTSQQGAIGDIFIKRAGGVDAPEPLVTSKTIKHPNDWSRDGRFLIYDDHHPSQRQDLWVVPLQGDRQPIPFLVTPADETFGQFSPDGQWIAYSSDESGRREVYVRGFAPERTPAAAVGHWTISSAGGDKPRWSADGKELFYIGLDGKMMSVPVKMAAGFAADVAVPLFDTRVTGFHPYDVASDGRVLINTLRDSASRSFLNVIVNWRAGLK